LLGSLPHKWHDALVDMLQFLCHPLLGKEYRKVALNIHKINGLAPQSEFSVRFQRQVIRHQIMEVFEVFRSMVRPDEIVLLGFDKLKSDLEGALAKKRGVVITTGHLGSWEHVVYAVYKATGTPLVGLAKKTKIAGLNRVIEEGRTRLGLKILWNDRKSLLRDMVSTLREGRCLGFVMDQRADSRKGHLVNFMGYPTEFVVGPSKTALGSKAPIVSVYCMKVGPMTFQVFSRLLWDGEQPIDDERALTQQLADDIGDMIKLYPEQWVWNYKRWNFAKKGDQ
jgi:KDO2-lipid IV(A) lauroyltransferase